MQIERGGEGRPIDLRVADGPAIGVEVAVLRDKYAVEEACGGGAPVAEVHIHQVASGGDRQVLDAARKIGAGRVNPEIQVGGRVESLQNVGQRHALVEAGALGA